MSNTAVSVAAATNLLIISLSPVPVQIGRLSLPRLLLGGKTPDCRRSLPFDSPPRRTQGRRIPASR